MTGELDRMNRFVEDLLLLAKAESPISYRLETVPLGGLTDELVAKAAAWPTAGGRSTRGRRARSSRTASD